MPVKIQEINKKQEMQEENKIREEVRLEINLVIMLMCDKVTHQVDWQPPTIPHILFPLNRIEKTSLIQYN